jgi:ribonuclease BN (tRNA processing enzyme)
MGGHSNWMLAQEFDFMIDAGEGAASTIGIGRLAALRNIFITHHHWDHVAGLFQLLNLRRRQDLKIPLTIWHPPSQKIENIKKMVGRGYDWQVSAPGTRVPVSKNLEIEPFEVHHRHAGCLGFKCFEKRTRRKSEFVNLSHEEISAMVQYSRREGEKPPEISEPYRAHIFTHTGDTEPIDPSSLGCPEILLHDSTYLRGMEAEAISKGHSSLGHALDAQTACGAKLLVALHLSPQHKSEIPSIPGVLIPSPSLRAVQFAVEGGVLQPENTRLKRILPVGEKTRNKIESASKDRRSLIN